MLASLMQFGFSVTGNQEVLSDKTGLLQAHCCAQPTTVPPRPLMVSSSLCCGACPLFRWTLGPWAASNHYCSWTKAPLSCPVLAVRVCVLHQKAGLNWTLPMQGCVLNHTATARCKDNVVCFLCSNLSYKPLSCYVVRGHLGLLVSISWFGSNSMFQSNLVSLK